MSTEQHGHTHVDRGPAGKPPADYGPIQLASHAGLPRWALDRARVEGLVPAPDAGGGRWSGAVADDIAARAAEITTAIGSEHPIGANRAAERIAARTGLEVAGDDVRQAEQHGHLHAVDEYKGHSLFDVRELDDLDPTVLEPLIAERLAWMAASLNRYDAAKRLGWTVGEFRRIAAERGLEAGRFGRYALADVDDLAADDELDEAVRGQRLLGPDQAAVHLEVRRTDFDYCTAAGWISPVEYTTSRISSRRTVDVALYRTADVEALRDIPGVDWEAVRATQPGQPSPLREFARLGHARATLVRGFAADLAEQHDLVVTADYDETRDQWELQWTPNDDGAPTREAVRDALRSDPELAAHARNITLRPTV